MILLKELQLNNFLSYKDAKLEFDPNTQLSIEGVSGSGKSSIVEAIIWALFGKGRCDNRNMVHSGAKDGTVTLTLGEGKKLYKIERSVTKTGKQTLTVSKKEEKWEPIETNGVIETQKWIENDFLHSSYILFINSIAYPQENQDSFLKLPAAKRKDLLLEITKTEGFDVYYTKARERAKAASEIIIKLNTIIETHKENISKNNTIVQEYSSVKDQYESLEAELKKTEDELETIKHEHSELLLVESEIVKTNLAIEENEKELEALKKNIDDKKAELQALENTPKSNADTEIKELESLKAKLKDYEEIQSYNFERQHKIYELALKKPVVFNHAEVLESLNKELIKLLTHEGFCPDGKHCTCYIKSTQERIRDIEAKLEDTVKLKDAQENALNAFNSSLVALGEARGDGKEKYYITETKEEIEELEEVIKTSNVDLINQKKESLRELIADKETGFSSLAEKINQLHRNNLDLKCKKVTFKRPPEYKQLRDKLEARKEELRQMQISALSKKTLAENAKNQLEESTNLLAKETERLNKYTEELEYFELLKDAFGNNGIKAIIIDYIIPRLEDSINKILGQMSEFRIKLETQKSTADGESVIEGLFIKIFNENGEEFDYTNYSGGQKMKIGIAVSEALASVQNIGFRIFDEAFTGLDDTSMDNFGQVMQELQQKFDQILCISHLRIIQDRFINKINIKKIKGISLIT